MKQYHHATCLRPSCAKQKTEQRPQLIALVGGSGAGKTWIARRLQRALGPTITRLSLDDFYQDHSTLPQPLRERVNLDHPRAIDWRSLESALHSCRAGRRVHVPQFSLATRTRLSQSRVLTPAPLIVVDGLWVLLRREVRELFDFRVYLECPTQLRLERRLARDLGEDGRNADSLRRQFWRVIAPMHERYVAPQVGWADIVMEQPPSEEEVHNLAETIRALIEPESPYRKARFESQPPMHAQRF